MGWILLAAYAAGFIVTARLYVVFSDGSDRGEERFNGTLVGLLWPLALALFAVLGLLALPTLGAKTGPERARERLQRAQAAELERREREARIAELEAENERLRATWASQPHDMDGPAL